MIEASSLPYLLAITLRLLVPLLILKRPFWGAIAAVAIDALDFELIRFTGLALNQGPGVDYERYQTQDKWLDLYWMSLAMWAAWQWEERLVRFTALALFLWRVIGTILFELTGLRVLLIIFPNLFEFFFIWCAYLLLYRPNDAIKAPKSLIKTLAVLLILKLGQELFLHHWEARPWTYMKHEILRWPR